MLAVGGGAVMDAAKAAGILATAREGELDGYFGVGMVSKKIRRIGIDIKIRKERLKADEPELFGHGMFSSNRCLRIRQDKIRFVISMKKSLEAVEGTGGFRDGFRFDPKKP